MSSWVSFANNLLNKVFSLEVFSVIEVKIEDYVHYDIVAREESLILHSYNDGKKINYEIVLHKENQSKTAFSIYRSNDFEECQNYYICMKDKLPIFVTKFQSLSISKLQEICNYINKNQSQNLAHICAYFGYTEFFKQLSTLSKIDELSWLTQADDSGKTPLFIAIECQRLNIIQTILLFGLNFETVDQNDNNILHYAAQTNGPIISTLCNSINTFGSKDSPTTSSANSSSEQAETKKSTLLYKLINTRNKSNFTPLYLACFHDKPMCVKELLKNGADVNGASICDKKNSNSEESYNLSDEKVINMLSVKDMKNGGTPLHWCKSAEVIEMLVDKNCNLNAKNFHGDTALHNMVSRNDLNCVIMLLSHGADVSAVGANGNSPLHLAIKVTNNIALIQALIVFGADLNLLNSSGDSPRHLAAVSHVPPFKDTILFVLHSVGACRCSVKKPNCAEGCAPDFPYNGVPPDNPPFLRDIPLYDPVLLESIIKKKLEEKSKKVSTLSNKKRLKLLTLDGGGIRGLILIQILCHLEFVTNRKINDLFDWVSGTSTGGILSLLLSSGYSASECRQIYFRLKDKLFTNYRPYCSDTLEKFLQKYLGSEKRMYELVKPRLMISATLVDRFPPNVQFFRNYASPNELLNIPFRNNQIEIKTTDELVWKVARATGAAPTYFSQFESYIDGGLISNNPTLDLLTEVETYNRANEILGKKDEIFDLDLVVSIGTGAIPSRPIDKLNFSPIFSLTGISNFATNLPNLLKVLIEQASQANGQVVDRAQAWCSTIEVPFYRLNPPISEEIQMDEADSVKLVNMLWETMAYINMHTDEMNGLLSFFLID